MTSSLLQWVLTMIPKSKDWVERLCPDSKLPNFNTGRILGLENQAVNESHELKGISVRSSRTSKRTQNPKGKLKLQRMSLQSEDHRTSAHTSFVELQKPKVNYKAQPYQYASSSKQVSKFKVKPFPLCTYCGFNYHCHDDCRNYPECEICVSYVHDTSRHNIIIYIRDGAPAESSQLKESSVGLKCDTSGSTVHSITNHNAFKHLKKEKEFRLQKPKNLPKSRIILGSLMQKPMMDTFMATISSQKHSESTRRKQIEETYHVTFNGSIEAIRFTNTLVPLSSYSNTHPQDRWSRDQHIEVVNIIGNPSEGMFTKSMAAKLTAASASECLFADFLSETEPKKVSEALKHPGCVDAMQEELNQFYKNKVWTLVLPLEENPSLVPNGYSGTRRMNIELSSGIKQGLLLKGIVKKKESIMWKHFLMLQDDESIFSLCYLFCNPFSSTTIGDENPIRTLEDYSKPSHEGYRNTIELPIRNNVDMIYSASGSVLPSIHVRDVDCWLMLPTNGPCLYCLARQFVPLNYVNMGYFLLGPSPQPQALETTFKARIRDYMATHTERMKRFENAIFKQCEGINSRMTEMLRLLKELATNRCPEKVTPDNTEKPTATEVEMPIMEAKTKNRSENMAENKSIKTPENGETVEAPSSQPITYNLKHKIRTQIGKKKGKEYKVLSGGPVYDAIPKKKITKKEDIRGKFEIPCSIWDLKHVNALVDQGSYVNVMPYSTYMKLTDERLVKTNIRLILASHSYIYPLGIAEDVLVKASPGMGRKDKASLGKGDEVQPMEEQKFQRQASHSYWKRRSHIRTCDSESSYKTRLESKMMRKCCFVVERDAWLGGLIGEFTLSSLDVLQGFSFFLQMGFTLILATRDGLDVGLLGDVIGEDNCDDDG
ncbi:hypothetical protein Tco_1069390 [Tanacetum coccineum]|uniref:Uncharacterized protein n=1 Tax=Tanacetum coccineum TaxID=301880 RepID=A0ABQ5HIC5_9ASTR